MDTTISIENPITQTYWNALKNLGQDVKLELISLLASSLTHTQKSTDEDKKVDKYFGAWKDDKSPEEMAKFIRDSRYTGTREILPLD